MVCSEATGEVCGDYLGNGSVTDRSVEGHCHIKCGNWKEEKPGEMTEMEMMWQRVKVKSER